MVGGDENQNVGPSQGPAGDHPHGVRELDGLQDVALNVVVVPRMVYAPALGHQKESFETAAQQVQSSRDYLRQVRQPAQPVTLVRQVFTAEQAADGLRGFPLRVSQASPVGHDSVTGLRRQPGGHLLAPAAE